MVTWPTYPETFIHDSIVAPLLLLSVVFVLREVVNMAMLPLTLQVVFMMNKIGDAQLAAVVEVENWEVGEL